MLTKAATLASFAFLAAISAAQTSPPYNYQSRDYFLTATGPTSGNVWVPPTNAYVRVIGEAVYMPNGFTIPSQVAFPSSLLTYLNSVNPTYWSFGTDFFSQPDYLSSKLYTDTYLETSGVFAVVPDPNIVQGQVNIRARWAPATTYSPVTGPIFPVDGKTLWCVVVRQDPNGAYTLLYQGGYPSYYSLGTNGNDDRCSNGNPWWTGSSHNNFSKLWFLEESFDLHAPATPTTTSYWMMLCNWNINGPYCGVTIRDALRVRLVKSSNPLPPDSHPR